MGSSQLRIVLVALFSAALTLCSAVIVTPVWAIDQDLTVQIKPGGAEGAGFGVVLWGETSHLTVTLTTPSSSIKIVQPTTLRCSGDFIWNWTSVADTSATVEALGIGRDDDHSIGFDGKYATTTGGGGTGGSENRFDVAVADVRIAGHKAEQTDDDAIGIPASDSASPLDAGTINVTVTLQASNAVPDAAGKLTLSWTDYAGIDHLDHNGVRIDNGGTIDVPRGGLSNEPIGIWTTEQFTDSATIQATFNWDSSFVAQNASAKDAWDNVQVASSLYALEVLDIQGFEPRAPSWVPGLDCNPNGSPIPLIPPSHGTSWKRNSVFADGTSVLVIRPLPKNGMSPVGVTYSIEYIPDRTIGAIFPQKARCVGSLSGIGTNSPSFGLPSLPAPDPMPVSDSNPDDGCGSTTVSPQTAAVFYRPPNNFLFGRQGMQKLRITGKQGNDVVARQDFFLIRPTIFLNHGVLSGPRVMYDMARALAGRYDGHGGRSIRVACVNWDFVNTSGYDTVAAILPAIIKAELTQNRCAGIAATRVDFFGHSMGGVVVKWYASNFGNINGARTYPGFKNFNWDATNSRYSRGDNFGVGDIRRLVTVGSPFRGSLIADDIATRVGYNEAVRRIGNVMGCNGDNCAVDDLGMNSRAMGYLIGSQAKVSWCPITGVGWDGQPFVPPASPGGKMESDLVGRGLVALLLDVAYKLPQDYGLYSTNSDFVVDWQSQLDRPWQTPVNQLPKHRNVYNVTHLDQATNGVSNFSVGSVARHLAEALDLWFANSNAAGCAPGHGSFNTSF